MSDSLHGALYATHHTSIEGCSKRASNSRRNAGSGKRKQVVRSWTNARTMFHALDHDPSVARHGQEFVHAVDQGNGRLSRLSQNGPCSVIRRDLRLSTFTKHLCRVRVKVNRSLSLLRHMARSSRQLRIGLSRALELDLVHARTRIRTRLVIPCLTSLRQMRRSQELTVVVDTRAASLWASRPSSSSSPLRRVRQRFVGLQILQVRRASSHHRTRSQMA